MNLSVHPSGGAVDGGSLAAPSAGLPALSEIFRTLTFQAGFNTNIVIAGTTLLGLAAGIISVFALQRKRSLTADAISHATLPGIAIAFMVAGALGGDGRSLPVLLLGAAVTAIVGVACIHLILRHTRLSEDAAIGTVLSVFFGAGIVALSYIQANASSGAPGLSKFIYGQTAAMSFSDAALIGVIALTTVLCTMLFVKELSLVCFNDAFARVAGWPVALIDLAMMGLVVAVTVAGLHAVGLILVVAMLIIPAVAARFWTERLWMLIVLAGAIGAASGYLGSVMSALMPRKPAGAVIVLTSGGIFVVSMIIAPTRGLVAASVRRARLQFRIAGEHLLEVAYETALTSGTPAELRRSDIDRVRHGRGWPWWLARIVLLRLRFSGYLRRSGDHLEVTTAGLERGRRVSRNHKLWEQYLISYADVAPNHVDWSVDQVEHVLSSDLIARLEGQLARQGIVVPSASPGEVLR